MGVYQRLQGRADAMIRKYGKPRVVTHTSVGAYNPETGKNQSADQTFPVSVVTFPYEIKFVNNTTVKMSDLWGFFSAKSLAVVPQPGDKLDVDGVTYTFGRVSPLNPGGVALLYECHLTQG